MLRLYTASVCPFAQRPRALLRRLDIPFEEVEIDLDDRPAEFLALTPTGKVPLLVEDDFRLYESLVVIEHLADAHGWDDALSDDPRRRARQRLAMKQWDDVVVPAWYRSLKAGTLDGEAEVRGELEQMERSVAGGAVDALPGFACATHWARARILADSSPLPGLVDRERPELAAWLDRAAEMEAIRATLPPAEELRIAYERRYVGAARPA